MSVWLRCAAETSPERGFDYHAARHSAGPPSVAGWAYHWINPLSVDTTKKELVGDFKNGGHEGQPKGRP